MNLRKNIYFKPLCLLVAALFTSQCISIKKELVSTEEKVIVNGSQTYLYELEKIKTPSAQDPTVEYRFVKFPANRVESIYTFKIKKVNRSSPILIGFLAGAAIGTKIGINSMKGEYLYVGRAITGFLIGSSIGIVCGIFASNQMGKNSAKIIETKESVGSYLTKKTGSIAIPVEYCPLEFKWGPSGKGIAFKTRADEQGIVRIHLIKDLKMTKVPPDHPLILHILYFNPEYRRKQLLKDSLGLENQQD